MQSCVLFVVSELVQVGLMLTTGGKHGSHGLHSSESRLRGCCQGVRMKVAALAPWQGMPRKAPRDGLLNTQSSKATSTCNSWRGNLSPRCYVTVVMWASFRLARNA